MTSLKEAFYKTVALPVKELRSAKLLTTMDATKITKAHILFAKRKFIPSNDNNLLAHQLEVAFNMYNAVYALDLEGLDAFIDLITQFIENKMNNPYQSSIIQSNEMKSLLELIKEMDLNPKINNTSDLILDEINDDPKFCCIIVTKYQNTALILSEELKSESNLIKPFLFTDKLHPPSDSNCIIVSPLTLKDLKIQNIDMLICYDATLHSNNLLQSIRANHPEMRYTVLISNEEEQRECMIHSRLNATLNKEFVYYTQSPLLIPEGLSPKLKFSKALHESLQEEIRSRKKQRT